MEVARWTYPPELISQLGRHSLSGGIWQDGELVVTGHDDPILFRLRLPRSGRELRLIGQESIPFLGQGFATDPITGGLIGIRRRQREIVLAVHGSAE